ncbi:MAG: replication restart helicase PriA [Tepidanaerobacteraceae bacterium]
MSYCAEVVIDVKHPDIKKQYTYMIPDELISEISVGDMVVVPFSRTKVHGVIVRIFDSGQVDGDYKLRNIIGKLGYTLPKESIIISEKLAEYYGVSSIDFLKMVFPPKAGLKTETLYTTATYDIIFSDRAFAQKKIYEMINVYGPISAAELSRRADMKITAVRSALRALGKKGFICKQNKNVPRTPLVYKENRIKNPNLLTDEQKVAVNQIIKNYYGERKTVLLYGVTGSGKTEVYIRVIQEVINNGKKVLLLVPEISLTPQMLATLKERFSERVAVIHSKLSAGERFDEWHRIYNGDVDIVVGARSAIFVPINKLGLIVVDEEHDPSYKQGEYPFYDARKVAEMRAELNRALLLFGSATPSVEAFYRAARGEFNVVKLTRRVTGRLLPKLEIIDMKQERKADRSTVFSKKLFDQMQDILQKGQQVILFINRRGYSTFVICRDCGFVLKCKYCDISLTYHFEDKTSRCHYCGYETDAPDLCPECGGRNIKYFGAGTEKVEQEIRNIFPGAKTLRMDSDSISRKGSIEKIISAFKRGKAQILIGTQVVAKGLDFPHVSLVGIINADTSLNMPDFRASERTFQMITQVAGRAGRGHFPGRVYIQTYCPEALAIRAACESNFTQFYRTELKNRKKSFFPPFCFLLSIIVIGEDRDRVFVEAVRIKDYLKRKLVDPTEIYGPVPAPRPRIKDNYRYCIIQKSSGSEALSRAAKLLKSYKCSPKIKVSWNRDPQDLL